MKNKKRLILAFVNEPPSAELASELNASSAERCPHGSRRWCPLQCGLERVDDGAWQVIAYDRRVRYITRLLEWPHALRVGRSGFYAGRVRVLTRGPTDTVRNVLTKFREHMQGWDAQ